MERRDSRMPKQKEAFNEFFEDNFQQLDLFTTAITRAHGKSHPEAFEVRELFETIDAKVKEAGASQLDLVQEFTQLRKVTDNYKVPGDVCETYASVYNLLAEADKSYHIE